MKFSDSWIVLMVCISFLSGACAKRHAAPASEQDQLFLDSVLTAKQKEQEAEAARAKLQTEDRYSEQALRNMREAMKTSDFRTPEFVLFPLPAAYRELHGPVLDKFRKEHSYSLEPNAEVLWENDAGIMIAGGRTDLPVGMSELPKQEFIQRLDEITKFYNEKYAKEYSSGASGSLEELGTMLRLTVTAKYMQAGEWFTDQKIFYFYNSAYSLDILIRGKDSILEKERPEIDKSLRLLEKRLRSLYTTSASYRL